MRLYIYCKCKKKNISKYTLCTRAELCYQHSYIYIIYTHMKWIRAHKPHIFIPRAFRYDTIRILHSRFYKWILFCLTFVNMRAHIVHMIKSPHMRRWRTRQARARRIIIISADKTMQFYLNTRTHIKQNVPSCHLIIY